MAAYTPLVDRLRAHGLSVDLDRYGQLRIYPKESLAREICVWIKTNRNGIIQELWPAVQSRILESLPKSAAGPAMCVERYQALRLYIAEHAPIRLVDYHCGIGTVTRITPPRPAVPAGTITMICDNGSYVDGDSRCFTYPDGSPVADVHWVAHVPSPETSGVCI